jgi:hypothetical protein
MKYIGETLYDSDYSFEKGDLKNDLIYLVTICCESTNGRMELFHGVWRDPKNRMVYLLDNNKASGYIAI